MKFGMQVEGLKAFNLSSNRFLKIQNGRRYDDITKINGIGHNYKSLNNAWMHMKFKLYIVHVISVILKNYWF